MTSEEVLVKAIDEGEITIDEHGRIWRNTVRMGGLGRHTKRKDPVRAENRINNKGGLWYLQLQLWSDSKRYIYMAHRVVWYSLHGAIPSGSVIHHTDNDPFNNHPDNLRLMTYCEHNSHHSHAPWNKGKPGGEWHEKTVIGRKAKYGETVKHTYHLRYEMSMSVQEVAKLLGVTTRTVHQHIYDYRKGVMPIAVDHSYQLAGNYN